MIHDPSFQHGAPAYLPVADPAVLTSPAAEGSCATRAAAGEAPLFTLPRLLGRASTALPGSPCDLAAPASAPPVAAYPMATGGLLAQLAALRAEQMARFGHTEQSDDAQDLLAFAQRSHRLQSAMVEYASLHNLEGTGTYALKLAALALALAESCTRRRAALQGQHGHG